MPPPQTQQQASSAVADTGIATIDATSGAAAGPLSGLSGEGAATVASLTGTATDRGTSLSGTATDRGTGFSGTATDPGTNLTDTVADPRTSLTAADTGTNLSATATDPSASAAGLAADALTARKAARSAASQEASQADATIRQTDSDEGVSNPPPSAGKTQDHNLVALLAADAAQDLKPATDAGKLDPDPSAKSAGTDSGNVAVTAGPNASAAHLSIASHLGPQRPEADVRVFTGDLKSPVGTAAWNDELGVRVTWLAHQGIESASLRLSPQHLGPMEVRISVQGADASVWFGAAQPDTRTALEQALPHLRDLFASQGLNLSNAGVFHEAPKDPPRSTRSGAFTSLSAVTATSDTPTAVATRLRLGLVDTYA